MYYPLSYEQKTVRYEAIVGAGVFAWQSWAKPPGCSMVAIFAVGGGGSGGGGLSGATTTARGGGSGGGASAIGNALFMANLIPDVLYILVGLGGAPSGNNTIGNAGGVTYVQVKPDTAASPADCLMMVNGGGAGQKGTTASASGGATGAATVLTSSCAWGSLAISWQSQGLGVAGGAGGTGAGTGGAGGVGNACGATILGGGCGGGGVGTSDTSANAGGAVSLYGPYGRGSSATVIVGGTGHVVAPGCDGTNGATFFGPYGFASYGGTGGGCNGDATVQDGLGGIGGSGGLGSGGGGGGGGITGASGGAGGNGIVIITSW